MGGDAELLAAAVLHDVVEDTDVTDADLAERFGKRTAAIVAELTDAPEWAELSTSERKARQAKKMATASDAARIIKIADQISNIRDLTTDLNVWPRGRHVTYLASARRVVEACRGVAPGLEAAFDDAARYYEAKVETMDRGA